MHAHARSESQASSSATHSLEQRHVISLSRFSKKQIWIQSQIVRLEESVLPSFESLDGVLVGSDVGLESKWQEMEEIEQATNELDQGELRSLRLLAKAASQKSLSPEDTDLIEITLSTLFSLDKLLHLLRVRSKALKLLQTRIKWNAQVAQVEKDRKTLLDHALPRFLDKARWRPDPHADTVADLSSSGPLQSSPLRNSVLGSVGLSRAPSSQQTRQMRAEIVSLDLAALTARLHTLLHSTMPASGKTLDALIDSSPEPLPERYLDAQDALEARTKAEVAGVDDFCRALAKQWKEADEIASSLDAQRTDLEQLGRDVREATLKLPADELASAFERRSAAAQDAQARIEGLLAKIRLPCHPERAPEQQHHNAELQELLQDRAEQSQQQLLTVQAGVNHYRQAVTTLLEAQAFIRDAAAALADLRQARTEVQPLVLDAISLRSFSDSAAFERDGLHRTGKLGSLEAALAKASQDVLPHAAGIASTLQQYGIDSNVRRQVQEAMLALASAGNAARSLLEWERQALGFRARAWTLWKAVENEVEAAVSRTAAANAYIARSRWRPASNASPASPTGLTFSEESTATAPASRLQVLEAQVQQLREELAHVDARLLTALDTSLAGARDAQTTTRRSEQLPVAVQRQKTEVQAVEALALSLIERLEAFAVLIEDLHLASVESILAPQTELETDCNSFSTGLSTRALLACPSETTLDVLPPSLAKELATLDDSVRSHVNTLATRVSALLAERKAATVELRGANEVREGLVRLQGEVATSHEQLAAIVSSAHASDADLRTRQARLSSLSTASSEMRARVAELDSVPRSGRLPKKAQRTLESLREVAVAAVDELVHGIREAQKRTEEELETMTFQADSQRQAEEEERAARAAAEELARYEEEEEERVEREAEANRRAEEDEEEAKDKRRRQATESEAEREPSETGAEEGPPTQSTAGITVSSSNPSIVFSPSDEDIQELSTRLRQKTATSEDVFGPEVYATEDALLRSVTASAEPVVPPPLSLSSPGLASVSAVSDLRDAIAELDLDSLLRPLPTSLSRQRLPTTQEAEAAQRQVSLAHAHLEDLACDGSEEEQAAYAATRQLLEEKAVDVGRVSQLAKFASLASESDAAISKLLDAVDDDKENEEGVDVREDALLAAECAVERTKEAARPVEDDPRVLQRLQQLQGVWRELRSLALREDAPHSPTDSQRSISRSSSIASELSTYSRRTVSGQSADNAARKRQSLRSVSRSSTVSNISSGSQAGPPSFASPRLPSSSSLSRIPVTASPRARTKSTSSAASLASRLPIPSSPAIPTPRRSASNSLAPRSTSRKSSRDAPTPTISTPTQLLQQSLAGRAKSEATSVNEEQSSPPSATRRSSNRRSSKKHLDLAQRPNHYRANSKRKLDVAVARIVNGMNVPVTITPAETHHDEVGRYFIGDPPRLYYARILRSKTVMLRVGGGWQELSSFLLTHFDSVFAPAQQVSPLQESARGHVSPQDARDSLGKSSNDARPWQNAAAFRASLARSTDSGNPVLSGSVACAGSGVKGSGTPRAVSHDSKRHMPSRRISGAYGAPSVPPIDLTALLVKTSTRSPPVANTHIPIQQQRSKSASIPWRL